MRKEAAMKETPKEKLEYILCCFVLLLIPLHLYLTFLNLFHGIDKGYGHSFPLRSYILIGLYLLILAAVDIFILVTGRFASARGLSRYWCSSLSALVASLFIFWFFPNASGLLLLLFLYSPLIILTPLLEYPGFPVMPHRLVITVLFCLLQWLICRRALKKP